VNEGKSIVRLGRVKSDMRGHHSLRGVSCDHRFSDCPGRTLKTPEDDDHSWILRLTFVRCFDCPRLGSHSC
jgi:hypothetical protein